MGLPKPVDIVETHNMKLHTRPFRSLVEDRLVDDTKVLVLRDITKDTFLEKSSMNTFRGGGYGWADQEIPRFHITEVGRQVGTCRRTSSHSFLLVSQGDTFSFTNKVLQTARQQSYIVQKVADFTPQLPVHGDGSYTFFVVRLRKTEKGGTESNGPVFRCLPDGMKRGNFSGLPRHSSMPVHTPNVPSRSTSVHKLVPNGIQVARVFIPTKEIRLVQRNVDHRVVKATRLPTLAMYKWGTLEESMTDQPTITGFGVFHVRCVRQSETSKGIRAIIYQKGEEGSQDISVEVSQDGLPYGVYRGLVPFVVVLDQDIKWKGANAYHVYFTHPSGQVHSNTANTIVDTTPDVSSRLSALVDKLLDPHNTNENIQQILQTFTLRNENPQCSSLYNAMQPPLLEVSIHGEASLPVFMARKLIQEARCVHDHTSSTFHHEAGENTVSENDVLRLAWSRDLKDDVCFLRLYRKQNGSPSVIEAVFLYEENLFSAITGLCRQGPQHPIPDTKRAPKYRIKGMVKSCNALLRLSMHPKIQVGKGITCGPFPRELYREFATDQDSLELLGLSVTKMLHPSVSHTKNSLPAPPVTHFEVETHESNAQNFSITNQNVNLGLLIQTTCHVDFAAITQALQSGVCHFITLPYQADSQVSEVPTATSLSPWLSTQATSILNTHGFALEGKGIHQSENRRLEKIDKWIRSLTWTDIQSFVWKRVRHNLYHQLAEGYKTEVLCNVRPDISTILFAKEFALQRFKESDGESPHGIVAYVFPDSLARQYNLPVPQPYLSRRPVTASATKTGDTRDLHNVQQNKGDMLRRMEILMAKVSSLASEDEPAWKTLQMLCSEMIFHVNALHAQLPTDVSYLNSNRDRLKIIKRNVMRLCKVYVNEMYTTKVKKLTSTTSTTSEHTEASLDLQRMQCYLHAHATLQRLERKDLQLPNNFGTCLNFYSSVVL